MKGKLIVIAFVALLLIGCAAPEAPSDDRFKIIYKGHRTIRVVYDVQTGVEYAYNLDTGVFTVLVDANGDPLIYEGYIENNTDVDEDSEDEVNEDLEDTKAEEIKNDSEEDDDIDPEACRKSIMENYNETELDQIEVLDEGYSSFGCFHDDGDGLYGTTTSSDRYYFTVIFNKYDNSYDIYMNGKLAYYIRDNIFYYASDVDSNFDVGYLALHGLDITLSLGDPTYYDGSKAGTETSKIIQL